MRFPTPQTPANGKQKKQNMSRSEGDKPALTNEDWNPGAQVRGKSKELQGLLWIAKKISLEKMLEIPISGRLQLAEFPQAWEQKRRMGSAECTAQHRGMKIIVTSFHRLLLHNSHQNTGKRNPQTDNTED